MILQECSMFINRFGHVMCNITRIRRHAINLCRFLKKTRTILIFFNIFNLSLCVDTYIEDSAGGDAEWILRIFTRRIM